MKVKFRNWSCFLIQERYSEGNRVALSLRDEKTHELIARCTVNLPDEKLGENEVFIKNYGENEGMLDALVKAGAVEDTSRSITQKFPTHSISYPIAKVIILK